MGYYLSWSTCTLGPVQTQSRIPCVSAPSCNTFQPLFRPNYVLFIYRRVVKALKFSFKRFLISGSFRKWYLDRVTVTSWRLFAFPRVQSHPGAIWQPKFLYCPKQGWKWKIWRPHFYMVSIVVARFYKGNYHTMITTTDCSHIVSRLPTSTCIMVPVKLLWKKTRKNTDGEGFGRTTFSGVQVRG
jgi:hypothetical protein